MSVSPVRVPLAEKFIQDSPLPDPLAQRVTLLEDPLPTDFPPKQTDVFEVLQGNDALAKAAYSISEQSKNKQKRGCCSRRSPKHPESKHHPAHKPNQRGLSSNNNVQQKPPPIAYNRTSLQNQKPETEATDVVQMDPSVQTDLFIPLPRSAQCDSSGPDRLESPRVSLTQYVLDCCSTFSFDQTPWGYLSDIAVPVADVNPSAISTAEIEGVDPSADETEETTPFLRQYQEAPQTNDPSIVPPVLANKDRSNPQALDLENMDTWADEPVFSSSSAAIPSQPETAGTDSLRAPGPSMTQTTKNYAVERIVRTEIQGNPALLQQAKEAIHSLTATPSTDTFFVTMNDGTEKEYYRAKYNMHMLLSAGQLLATNCGYPTDITVSLENHTNGVVYACITFRKRIDHAQVTYHALRKKWNIQDEIKPLSFATPCGIWGMYKADDKKKIEQTEQFRTRTIEKFCLELYENNAPRDPAFERIYRPTPEERRKFLKDYPDAIEYIAATDCIMFIYKPVRKEPVTQFVTMEDGTQKEYYRPPFTVRELMQLGDDLATQCEYPDMTVSLNNYTKGVAYACITFQKRIDHAEATYRQLRFRWNIQEDEKPLQSALPFEKLESNDTPEEIDDIERKRTRKLDQFVQKYYKNGVPKDPALEAIYRPTAEQRRELFADDPNHVENIAATDCIMFVKKAVG